MKTGFFMKKNQTKLSGFYVVYYGSTLNEKKGTYGLSHLMEHLMCKSFDDLYLDFDRDGISWNAYTDSDHVVFYLTGLDEYVNKWKKIFYQRLLNFNITEEQLENEKKIVYEEYLDSFNTQPNTHYLNLYRKIFNEYSAIGLGEDIQNVTLDICKDFFNNYLSKPHRIIDISQKRNKENMEFFKNVEYNNIFPKKNFKYLKKNDFPKEITNDFKNKTSIMFLSPIIKDDFIYTDFICKMLIDGLKSPLYDEVREKRGLVYYLHCYVDRVNFNNGIVNIMTETSNENVDELYNTIEMVLKNPDKFLTKERFETIKTKYKIVYQKNKINQYNSVMKFILPSKWNLSDMIDKITYEDVMEKYNRYFNFDNFYKSYDTSEFKIDAKNIELTTEEILEMTR